MPTIGEVYGPLVEAAIAGNEQRCADLLYETGVMLYENNREVSPSIQAAIEQAKINLDYYCQYYDSGIAMKVKQIYNLGTGFRTLLGGKL